MKGTRNRATELLGKLPRKNQEQLLTAGHEMARLARGYAVPIIFAPPLGVKGKINGATGFALRLDTGVFIFTAFHVLYDKGGYVTRTQKGERVHCLVGSLPPFGPIPRVAWADQKLDIVLLHISEHEAATIGPCIVSSPPKWPPDPPEEGELVLMAGYPKTLRKADREAGSIGSGPLSAVFRVEKVKEDHCICVFERTDLVPFEGKLPQARTKINGMSGAPVLRVQTISYPVVGAFSGSFKITTQVELVQFATLNKVTI